MHAVERERNYGKADAMDTSGTLSRKRNRAMDDAVDNSDDSHGNQVTRCRVGDLRSAFAVDKEITKEHAQRRHTELKARWNTPHASAVEGVGAAISAKTAEDCNRVLGEELP